MRVWRYVITTDRGSAHNFEAWYEIAGLVSLPICPW
jgi:hypothetical protein